MAQENNKHGIHSFFTIHFIDFFQKYESFVTYDNMTISNYVGDTYHLSFS